jgi:hypothetical protein
MNNNVIRVKNLAAQGDVLFRRIDKLPIGVVEQPRSGPLVVAHSETGHHHSIHESEVKLFERAERDPMVCYLSVGSDCAAVVHHRPHDTHRTIGLTQGIWEVRRQREWTPEGLRRVED